jgi:hypothetical protein
LNIVVRSIMTTRVSSTYEETEKATRGGGELELIKIHLENLAYILKSARRASLLSQPRSHSYRKSICPQNWVSQLENIAEDDTRCKQSYM